MEFWETGFYDKDGNKLETDAVLAALFSKINQLEERVNELEDFYNSTDWDDLKCTVDSLDRTSVRRRSYY